MSCIANTLTTIVEERKKANLDVTLLSSIDKVCDNILKLGRLTALKNRDLLDSYVVKEFEGSYRWRLVTLTDRPNEAEEVLFRLQGVLCNKQFYSLSTILR